MLVSVLLNEPVASHLRLGTSIALPLLRHGHDHGHDHCDDSCDHDHSDKVDSRHNKEVFLLETSLNEAEKKTVVNIMSLCRCQLDAVQLFAIGADQRFRYRAILQEWWGGLGGSVGGCELGWVGCWLRGSGDPSKHDLTVGGNGQRGACRALPHHRGQGGSLSACHTTRGSGQCDPSVHGRTHSHKQPLGNDENCVHGTGVHNNEKRHITPT